MINKFLHALSNRNGPFIEPCFVGASSFTPKSLSEQERKLREKLMLHITNTDHYLKRYVSCVEAYPDIHALLNDSVTSYTSKDFSHYGVSIIGADFLDMTNAQGRYIDNQAQSIPVELTYEINYHDSTYVKLVCLESNRVWMAVYQLAGDPPGQIMRIEWPMDVPFDGPLRLTQVWLQGGQIKITVEPSSFPYAEMAQRVRSDSLLTQWLAAINAIDEFYNTRDVNRQVALACVVLALSNTSVYPVD
jgi:hypothetical protein